MQEYKAQYRKNGKYADISISDFIVEYNIEKW